MLRVLSGVRVQQSGGKARSLTVTKPLKTEATAGPAVTLRSMVELASRPGNPDGKEQGRGQGSI